MSAAAVLPLSSAQFAIWLDCLVQRSASAYNIGEYLEIFGPIDSARLAQATNIVVAQTPGLRMVVVEDSGHPMQRILDSSAFELPFIDVSTEPNPLSAALNWMSADMKVPFNLATGPLFKFAIFRLSASHFIWYAKYHHLVSDGVGLALVAGRLANAYTSISSGHEPSFSPDAYEAYLNIDKRYRVSAGYVSDKAYWTEVLQALPPSADLSIHTGSAESNEEIQSAVGLDQTSVLKLRRVAQKLGCTLSQVVTAAVALYVYRITGVADLTLGWSTSGRLDREMRACVSPCSNHLPLRFAIEPATQLGAFVQNSSLRMKGALRHQRYRYADIKRDMNLTSRNQDLFSITVNIMPFDYALSFAGAPVRQTNLSIGPVNGLSVAVYDHGEANGLRIVFHANGSKYERWEIDAHLRRFASFLESMPACVGESISDGPRLIDMSERSQLKRYSQGPTRSYSSEAVHECIREQAARVPDATALVFGTRRISYGELEQRSNALAHYLQSLGVGTEDVVGLCMDRSPELVLSMIAVLKSGAAYLPLDPSYPAQRLSYMLQDSAASTLIVGDQVDPTILNFSGTVIESRKFSDVFTRLAPSPPVSAVAQNNLAYLLYTSGSTGAPKGVMIEHGQLSNYAQGVTETLGLSEFRRFASVQSFSFDSTGTVLFSSLISGAELHIMDLDTTLDPASFSAYMEANQIDCYKITPSHLAMLLAATSEPQRCLPKQLLIVGGESLTMELLRKVRSLSESVRITTHYGPTEATVGVTTYNAMDTDAQLTSHLAPIGKPLPNCTAMVLDHNRLLLPIGCPGEFYIGGPQVARGYFAQPKLTAERFIDDPTENRGRLYRTGDLARWLPSGVLEFLGRGDTQVKINGMRIELGEIESTLLQFAGVKSAVVIDYELRPAEKHLVAYVVFDRTNPLAENSFTIREWASSRLPRALVPSIFRELDELPLLPNGKLDRSALPRPVPRSLEQRRFRPPVTETQLVISQVWTRALGVDSVGLDDDFFECGGHSLLAIRLVSEVGKLLSVRIPARTFFENTTLENLANEVDRLTQMADQLGKQPPSFASTQTTENTREEMLWFMRSPHD